MTASTELDRSSSNLVTREYEAEPGRKPELPSATQVLRTSPRHFARLTGLPRKTCRYSSSVSEASHSRSGKKRDCSCAAASGSPRADAEFPFSVFAFGFSETAFKLLGRQAA